MFDIIIKDGNGKISDKQKCAGMSCTIGRSGKNLIRLKGWRIGAVHAELSQNDQGIFVTDCDSGPAIRVNDNPAKHYGPLTSSDEITIGSFKISVIPYDLPERTTHTPSSPKDNSSNILEGLPARSILIDDDSMRSFLGVRRRPEVELFDATASEHRFLWHDRVHQKLVEMMDLRRMDIESMDESQLTKNISDIIQKIITDMGDQLPPDIDRKILAREVLNEAIGLGPLEEFLADETITEIMVNRFDEIYLERNGLLEKTNSAFSSNNAVLSVIERIVSPLGRRIDESSPMVDARLKDGSRVNAIIPPLSLKGPSLTIRKFSNKKLAAEDMIKFGSANSAMMAFLEIAVKYKKNIIISGGTGSGKTTLLNVLSNFIPHNERIVTVEDSAELKLGQPHVVTLEGRPPNIEGKGAVTIRDLVKNCLRMRPDRIVVGECRGGETLDMLQAMNTGHSGSLTTVHANTPRDLISRLEVMVMMAGLDLPDKAIREQVVSAVDIIVQQSRFTDGSRKITHISEVTGLESGTIQMQDIFIFQQQGFDNKGKISGKFLATGNIPEFYENIRNAGFEVNMHIFKEERP